MRVLHFHFRILGRGGKLKVDLNPLTVFEKNLPSLVQHHFDLDLTHDMHPS